MHIKKSYLIFLITLLNIGSCLGQQKTNIISCEEYGNITFNGITIDQINATEGTHQKVKQLLGTYTSVEEDKGSRSRSFMYGNNRIGFNYEFGYVSRITIKDAQWPVKIKGHAIRVGDSEADLKQAFGSDLIVTETPYFSNNIVSFNCQGNNADGLHIHVNPETDKVVKIKYWVNP